MELHTPILSTTADTGVRHRRAARFTGSSSPISSATVDNDLLPSTGSEDLRSEPEENVSEIWMTPVTGAFYVAHSLEKHKNTSSD